MKNRKFIAYILMLFLTANFLFCSSESNESTKPSESSGIIDADNPAIQYVGRFNFSNPKSVTFDWPGVTISAASSSSAIPSPVAMASRA